MLGGNFIHANKEDREAILKRVGKIIPTEDCKDDLQRCERLKFYNKGTNFDLGTTFHFNKQYLNNGLDEVLISNIFETVNNIYGNVVDNVLINCNQYPIICYMKEHEENKYTYYINIADIKSSTSLLSVIASYFNKK
jgi:hypothetical protein